MNLEGPTALPTFPRPRKVQRGSRYANQRKTKSRCDLSMVDHQPWGVVVLFGAATLADWPDRFAISRDCCPDVGRKLTRGSQDSENQLQRYDFRHLHLSGNPALRG